MILIAVCIFLEDRGPILFLQERIGLREIPFLIYKFRTMRDGKVTRVGRILRRTGLDELAQLFNILLGDMNIVGPRPLTKFDIDRLGWNQYKFVKRFSVKPGLTGLAQVIHFALPALPVHTPISFVLLAEGIAIAIGLLAGVLPARNAARLDPVEALRAE